MNEYIISPDLNDNRLVSAGSSNELKTRSILSGGVIGFFASAFSSNTIMIETIGTLKKYHNCHEAQGNKWLSGLAYVEHPRKPGYLIQKNLYKDYMVREMMADIAGYIMDYYTLQSLTIGLVETLVGNGDVTVPTEEYNSKAQIHCQLNRQYVDHFVNTRKIGFFKKRHLWINDYPDVKIAVESGSQSFEKIEKISISGSFNIGVNDIKGLFDGQKELQFYIAYLR